MNLPLVSVVIIGRNEGQRLVRCLQSVVQGSGDACQLEIIYVDSASVDDSVSVATSLGALALPLTGGRLSAARARNAGWRAAHGQFILFLDGDTVLHPDFLCHALASMKDEETSVVWGHRREMSPQQSVYVRVLDLDWIYPPGESDFCGGDALMRRVSLEACGGFNDALIAGEEPEMCSRIRAAGGHILHMDVPMTSHDLAIVSFSAYWRRAYRAGHAYAQVAQLCRSQPGQLWSNEVRGNWLRGGVLLFSPLFLFAAYLADPVIFLVALLAACAVLCRSALLTRAKSKQLSTRILYAVHSHFQHLPMLFGQLGFHLDCLLGRQRGLIEYKQGSAQ